METEFILKTMNTHRELPTGVVEVSCVVQDVNEGERMTHPNFVIVLVMSWGDLYSTWQTHKKTGPE